MKTQSKHAPEEIELAVFIETLVQLVKDTGQQPAVVVNQASLDQLSAQDLRDLAVQGVLERVNNKLHTERNAAARIGASSQPGRDPTAWHLVMHRIYHLGADHTMKRLVAFDRADLEAFAVDAAVNSYAWRLRGDWARRGLALLELRVQESLVRLSADDLAELDELAAKAWSR